MFGELRAHIVNGNPDNMDFATMEASYKTVSEQFLEAKKALEERDRELEAISLEMALGLSEVFEALKKISSGDPMVRIPENSSLELISKLKELVNRTAENLGEIVDLSHEFAMGLAEHFDVMHRLTRGDLTARVRGESTVELLESLKHVTNQMIKSVHEEIKERAKAQEAIKRSEEKYRTLIENIQDGVFIIQDNKFLFASVLIVDDSKEQRMIATAILSNLGYQVAAVSCGEEAVEYIKKNPVDLLVLDMIMGPGMDGLETFREIVKWKSAQKAVIASGFAETSRVKEAQRLGAGEYVKKPYAIEKIGFAVRKELDKPIS